MSEDIDYHRRRFFGTAAMSVAAVQFGMASSADAQSSTAKPADVPAIKPGTNTSFPPLKQIDAGPLNVGYAEAGPANALSLSSCTAGRTIFTALSMLRRCWRRQAIG